MKLLTSVLLFSVGALAHPGWTIPRDHPSGVYNVVADASGNSKHVLVRHLSASTKPALSDALTNAPGLSKGDLSKRKSKEINGVQCENHNINATDANAAVDSLKTQCADGLFIKKKDILYAKHGDVVAYFCNLSDHPKVCNGKEVIDTMETKVSTVCRDFVSGHYQNDQKVIGYGKFNEEFCDGKKIKEDD